MIKRVDRLLRIRKRLHERAAARHALATHALRDAQAQWQQWADLRNVADATTRGDELDRQTHGLLQAQAQIECCQTEVLAAEEDLSAASRALKQSETLHERVREESNEEERREEQRTSDDLRSSRGL